MTMIRSRLLAVLFSLPLSALCAAHPAPQEAEVLRISPPEVPGDPNYYVNFGFPLEFDGEWLLTTDRGAGPGGEVYFYRETEEGWHLSQVIGGTQAGGVEFGSYIDADNGRLVIGSPGWRRGSDNIFFGKVDVFDLQPNGQWEMTAELFPTGFFCPRNMGSGVAISGDTLVTRTRGLCGPITPRIHVYTLEASGWELQQTLHFNRAAVPPSLPPVGNLSTAMALDGDTLVVGLPGEFGGAVVYRRTGTIWNRVALLTDPETIQRDYMGRSVAIDGPTIVVGSDAITGGGPVHHGGAATVFEEVAQDQWVKTARLRPSDPFSSQDFGDQFGGAVAVDGDEIVVGAKRAPLPGVGNPGKVYYFRKGPSGWPATETAVFVQDNPANGDRVGVEVDIRNGLVLAGLWGGTSAHTGNALLFGVNQGSSYCATTPNSTGSAAYLRAVGSDIASEESLVLAVSDAPAAATGGFIASGGSANRPLFNGFLCLASPVRRLGTVRQANQEGEMVLRVDVDAIGHLWASASTLYLQYWHTDTIGQGIGLSNAVSLTLR